MARDGEHTATRAEIPPIGKFYDVDGRIDEVAAQDTIDLPEHGD